MTRPQTDLALAVARLRVEYREMPGLSLTAAQAARLAGLERPLAADALRQLEMEGFLARNWSGRFLRRDGTLFRRPWAGPSSDGMAPRAASGLQPA